MFLFGWEMRTYEVLHRPVITEKNTELMARNKYTFEVARNANKHEVKEAVEKAFKVKVARVNMVTVPAKERGFGRLRGKTSPWKKAIVTLEPGSKIEIFEGV
jgi:large subunit ribosomal protein L23